MSIFARIAAGAVITLLVPFSCASAATQFTTLTAPDAVSRAILSVPAVRFEDGAESKGDVPAAIARNYPQIIEQNFARMDASATHALINNLSDVELQAIAQLYANANADTHRTGALLLIAADRLDGPHLARLSRFFGYAPVYDAIAKIAPTKAQIFAQNAPIMYAAPLAGGATPAMMAAQSPAFVSKAQLSVTGGGALSPTQTFKPVVSMTFEQLYTGFRTMQVGSMAGTAALYETTVYAGGQLGAAYAGGYAIGTGLTWVAQTYLPDWYYGTFVDAVGSTVDWFQSVANTVGSFYGSSIYDLGQYEINIAPVMNVPSGAVSRMETSGGDAYVTQPMVVYLYGGGGCVYAWDCHQSTR
ncbi:MAG TPA: hypothetical protein VIP05_11700 [Burkholderiaceae bacterium]